MAEEHGGSAVAFGRVVQRRIARVAGRGLGSAFAAHVDGDGLDGIETQRAEAGGDFGRAEVGAVLEAVVDGDATGPDGELACLEGERGGEGHRVGAAGAGHEHEGLVDGQGGPAGQVGPGGRGGRMAQGALEPG